MDFKQLARLAASIAAVRTGDLRNGMSFSRPAAALRRWAGGLSIADFRLTRQLGEGRRLPAGGPGFLLQTDDILV